MTSNREREDKVVMGVLGVWAPHTVLKINRIGHCAKNYAVLRETPSIAVSLEMIGQYAGFSFTG